MRADDVLSAAFHGLNRLAPGSESSTLRALAAARRIREPERILDIGCGAGAQTLVLARNTSASVVAVDTSEVFLTQLREKAEAASLGDHIVTHQKSMHELDFPAESFDLLWAEGSAYVMGFDAALGAWRELLAPGGVLALTELTWMDNVRSVRASTFWGEAYPAMRNVDENVRAAESAGYRCVDRFNLPKADWVEEYYAPLANRLAQLRSRYSGVDAAQAVLDSLQSEIDLYTACGGEYGYTFYILGRG